MSTKASHFKIGLFVIFASVAGIAVVVALGAGAIFRKTVTLETVFKESVEGLEIGSMVKQRGVAIGKVSEIDFARNLYRWKPDDPTFDEHWDLVVVRVALSSSDFTEFRKGRLSSYIDTMVGRGLRIKLVRNAISGTAYLEADYHDPERTPPFVPPWRPAHPYIPSTPGILTRLSKAVDEVLSRLEKTEIEGLVTGLDQLLHETTDVVRGIDIQALQGDIRSVASEVRGLTTQVRSLVGDPKAVDGKTVAVILADLGGAAERANQVLEEVQTMVAGGDIQRALGALSQTSDSLVIAVDELPGTIARLNNTLRRLDRIISSKQYDLETTIENIRSITDNLNEITTNAKKYPAHVIFGQPPKRTDPEK